MQATSDIILFDDGGGRLASSDGEVVDLAPAHATLGQALAAGATRRVVTLGLPSHWCMCVTFDAADLPSRRRQAMIYCFEERLPVAVEDIVPDFVESQDQVLGVAGQLDLLRKAVAEAEAGGAAVESIVPTALLAAQWYVEQTDLADCQAILFTVNNQAELLHIQAGLVTSWDTLSPEQEDISLQLRLSALAGPLRVACGELAVPLPNLEGVELVPFKWPPAVEAAAHQARAGARSGVAPWVELCREPLRKRNAFGGVRLAARAAGAAALVLGAALIIGAWFRGSAYHLAASQYEQAQIRILQATLPQKAIAPGLSTHTQLLREERRLRGMTAGAEAAVPEKVSELVTLHRILRQIPADGRRRITDLRLSNGRFQMEGTVPSHADATALATALASDTGFRIDPPRTEQTPGGGAVNMMLTATPDGRQEGQP